MDSLTGKIALVTGASRGLGKGIALELAKAGAEVIVNYRSGKNEADCAVNEIISNNGKAVTFGADVSETEDVKKLFGFIREKYGRLDILVNNAGTTKAQDIFETSEDDWDFIIKTNLKSLFLCTKKKTKPPVTSIARTISTQSPILFPCSIVKVYSLVYTFSSIVAR